MFVRVIALRLAAVDTFEERGLSIPLIPESMTFAYKESDSLRPLCVECCHSCRRLDYCR